MRYSNWLKTGLSKKLKARRFHELDAMCDYKLTKPTHKVRILDVGCAQGKDVLSFMKKNENIDLYGLDIKEYDMINKDVTFIIGDAAKMDYPDNYFDVTLSVGMLEHIQPMESMCQVIKEINRVSKEFYIMVPAITTPYEPHTHQFLWGLSRHRKHHPWLLFFDDLTWLKFEGFKSAYVKRFWYIPGLISNLIIYKNSTSKKQSSVSLDLFEKFKY